MLRFFKITIYLAVLLIGQADNHVGHSMGWNGGTIGNIFQHQRAGSSNDSVLGKATAPSRDITRLPAQKSKGKQQLAILLAQRHSVRSFSSTPLTLAHLGQLLWAAQGMTHEGRRRTAPSAGALYPLELFVLVGRVEGLAVGVYQYEPQQHALRRVQDGDRRQQVASAVWE